jgi:glycerophosphoryl diester phosphodiesterase
LAPENTLVSLRKAAALGASWVEFDVRLTADGGLVLMHDDTLQRTTGAQMAVLSRPQAEIERLDAGAWFAPEFRGERVPSLRSAIAVLTELGLGANIEVKSGRREAERSAGALIDILESHWPASLPLPLISSFEPAVLSALRLRSPRWPRGLLLKRLHGDWRGLCDRLEIATLNLDHRPLDRAAVSLARRAGAALIVYTVNDPRRARTLLGWGVAAVVSDHPDLLR